MLITIVETTGKDNYMTETNIMKTVFNHLSNNATKYLSTIYFYLMLCLFLIGLTFSIFTGTRDQNQRDVAVCYAQQKVLVETLAGNRCASLADLTPVE